MADLDDVVAILRDLPGVETGERHGRATWSVGGHGIAWDRAFSKADVKRFGDAPVPDGPILAIRTTDLHEKEAVLAEGLPGFFTIPHFDNYPAYLVHLAAVSDDDLREALVDAWLAHAPRDVADEYVRTHPR